MHLALLLAGLVAVAPARLVLDAPDGAPPDASLTWRAWSPGHGEVVAPLLVEDHVGAAEPRVLSLRLPSGAEAWTLLVEGEAGGDAWIAVARGFDAFRAELRPVPVPEAEVEPARSASAQGATRVRLSWRAAAAPVGLGGWQVLRSVGFGEPEIVGEVGASASSFVDEPPAGEITWRLRPVLAEGVTGPAGRASDPLMLLPTAAAPGDEISRRSAADMR